MENLCTLHSVRLSQSNVFGLTNDDGTSSENKIWKCPIPLLTQIFAMRVMFTVFYLTIGFNGLSLSIRPCENQQDPGSFTMDQVEGIVYALASDKGVLPTVILNRLLRKVRVRQREEKTKPRSELQEIALQELINSKSSSRNPPGLAGQIRLDRLPPESKPFLPPLPGSDQESSMRGVSLYPLQRPSQRFPTESGLNMPQEQTTNLMTGMLLPPGFPQLPHSIPQSIFIPFPNLGPPPGVTIRVKAGSSVNTFPEVTVTLSPMMTIVEALKQAESKFRSVLRLSSVSEDDVISFSRSSYAECYVIRSFDNIESGENGIWKIIVNDISGKVIYDSVCLPSRNEVAVKPGMTITLLYTLV